MNITGLKHKISIHFSFKFNLNKNKFDQLTEKNILKS